MQTARRRISEACVLVPFSLPFLLLPAPLLAAELGPVQSYVGTCEPSGAIAVEDGNIDGAFLVASDEDNILRIYVPGKEIAVADADLNAHLGLDPDDENEKADFEAAARLGDKTFILGSHSRSNKGKRRLSRETLLSVELTSSTGGYGIKPGNHAGLLAQLGAIPAIQKALPPDDMNNPIALDSNEQYEVLAPEKGGLNIEGMAGSADGRLLLIGLRNPLGEGGRALIVPLQNPTETIDGKAPPDFGEPYTIDLGGRGIRSLEYSPGAGKYFIVAGPHQTSGSFELYTWSGNPADQPQKVEGTAALFDSVPDFHPEAMLVDKTGLRIRLFSDDGDLPVAEGGRCQDIPDKGKQAFRSVVLTLP